MSYKFGGFNFVESGYLDPVYAEPPYSFHLNVVTINPEDTDDPIINASNPSNGGNGAGGGGGDGGGGSYGVGSYSGAVGFDASPLDTNSGQRWKASKMFWAAGSLWVVITSDFNSASNPYYRRSLLYKLDANAVFQYQNTGLEEYRSTFALMSDQGASRVLKTPTGISLFFPASDSLPFGTSGSVAPFGIARLEIQNNGSIDISYVPHTAIPLNGTNQPYVDRSVIAVHDNRAYLNVANAGSNTWNIGTFNGIEYIAGVFRGSSQRGFPVSTTENATASQYLYIENTPNNVWSDITNKEKTIQIEADITKTFYTNSTTNLDFRYTNINHDGNILHRIRVDSECDNGATTCTTADSATNYYLYIQSTYNDQLTLLDTWAASGNTDANQIVASSLQSTITKIAADQNGHIVLYKSGKIYYYQAGTNNAIEITSQVPLSSGLRTNEAITPYGFGLLAHSGFIFSSSSNPTLIFIQPI